MQAVLNLYFRAVHAIIFGIHQPNHLTPAYAARRANPTQEVEL
jgi:hypothetical protein